MTERTTVHVMRHGEVYNPTKILYGRLPGFRLSSLGEQMAERAGEYFASKDITYVVASPLERAQQTAGPTAQAHGLPIATDLNLIEADNVFEGERVSVGDGVLRMPSTWRHLWNPFKPSWGEPYVDLAARMRVAIESARDAARGHRGAGRGWRRRAIPHRVGAGRAARTAAPSRPSAAAHQSRCCR